MGTAKGDPPSRPFSASSSTREQGYQWVVDADIQSFFDEVDHARLLAELRAHVSDDRVLDLIHRWLQAEIVEGDRRWRLTQGIPQGSPISPLLANLYLDRFDEALLGAGHKLVRFADDFVILCRSRPQAEEALELTEEVLTALRLHLSREKTRIVDFNHGFRYLGVEFIRSLAFRPLYPEEVEPAAQQTGATAQPALSVATGTGRDRPDNASRPPLPQQIPDTSVGRALEAALAQLPDDEADEVWEALLAPQDSEPELEPSAGQAPLLRTLYLVEQGAVLAKTDERFVISKDRTTLREVPAIKVDQIMVFGNVQLTTPAMKFCLTQGIPIVLLSSRGRYFGAIESTNTDQVLLHRDQFVRAADPTYCLRTARAIVRGKVTNERVVLQRYARHRPSCDVGAQLATLKSTLSRLAAARSMDELRGYEGAAAARYFAGMRVILGDQWGFTHRRKQPPPDPVNSLLSLGYTLLFYNVYALVRAHGLNPGVGSLHPMHQGHPALVSDLIEEFRAPIVDAMVLHLILRGHITQDEFHMPAASGLPCLLNDAARKRFIAAFEEKMNSRVTHPGTGFLVDYRRCLDLQVQRLARSIRDPREVYEPMTIR